MQILEPTPLLDVATKLTGSATAVWRPTVGEHSVQAVWPRKPIDPDKDGEPDHQRSEREAQRRAAVTVRRYCKHNRIDRLVTLTLAASTELADRPRVLRMVQRALAELRHRKPSLRYVYVLELHPGGHGYHVHVGVNAWLSQALIRDVWRHGWIDIRRIKSKSRGSDKQQAALTARYLAKYVVKSTDDGRRVGSHRYERSQGSNPPEHRMEADSFEALVAWVSAKIRGPIAWRWSSIENGEDWHGPPTLCLWE